MNTAEMRTRAHAAISNPETARVPEIAADVVELVGRVDMLQPIITDAYAALAGYSEGEPGEALRRLIAENVRLVAARDHAVAALAARDVECARLRAWIRRDTTVAPTDLFERLVALSNGRCLGTIAGTFVACGEGGNYCSEACRLRARLAVVEPVFEAAKAWSESFGELSKRLPPHVHALRDAVDAAEKAQG